MCFVFILEYGIGIASRIHEFCSQRYCFWAEEEKEKLIQMKM